ncbi:MAG: hypothetical protein KF867_08225 [Cryobacterium sp.]|nr:hypothetical protein [Cryobacterium sp.]
MDSEFVFPEPVFRREVLKIRHALKAFDQLSETTQSWSKSAKLRFVARNSITKPEGYEIVGKIDSLPPVEEWWFQASDAFGNMRNALDQLNHNIFHYVSRVEPGHLRFPMATKGSQWRDWRKSAHAAGFPAWLIARYKRFQPYTTHRPTLTTLEKITNKEKHREGVTSALSLTRAEFGPSQFSVTPMLPDDFDFSLAHGDFPPTIELSSTEFPITTVSIPGHSILLSETELSANFEFRFTLRIDTEEIPLESATNLIVGDVLWATLHIIGRETATTKMPKNFDLSLESDAPIVPDSTNTQVAK